jgi:pre-60S factor REI1
VLLLLMAGHSTPLLKDIIDRFGTIKRSEHNNKMTTPSDDGGGSTPVVRLTSTTAPNKIFHSRDELAQHYKSDWHKYNCKRKEAGLPLLIQADFEARLEAAMAVKRERDQKQQEHGKDHLKKGKDRKNSKATAPVPADKEDEVVMEEEVEEEAPVIDPCQSLFDNKVHSNVVDNVKYMQHKYGFFVPDAEYLVDISRLIGYCQEKIMVGQICLYCQRGFRSSKAVKDHMVDTRHTKICYEEGVDLWEYEPFYDFSEANKEFWAAWGSKPTKRTKKKKKQSETDAGVKVAAKDTGGDDNEMDDDDSTQWEDVTDDENEDDSMDLEEKGSDDDEFEDYASNIAQHGFGVTPLGELIFPDGRVVGHRAMSRYYKQRILPQTERVAVRAARLAASGGALEDSPASARTHGTVNQKLSRDQAGVLVRAGNGGSGTKGGFTSLSLYRHQALVKKARREESKSRRFRERVAYPINKLDKKANRIMNNVSVAHAPR